MNKQKGKKSHFIWSCQDYLVRISLSNSWFAICFLQDGSHDFILHAAFLFGNSDKSTHPWEIMSSLSQNTFQDWDLGDWPQVFIMDMPVNPVNLFSPQFFQGVQAVSMSCPKTDFIHFYLGVTLASLLRYVSVFFRYTNDTV